MGVGHLAVGLGLKSVDSRLNAGVFVFTAFLADFLLGWFVWAGWESYEVPRGYASGHYLLFTFPWSHGLAAALLWSLAAAGSVGLILRNRRAGVLAGIAALSHFLLDAAVHVKGLPLAGPGSYEVGLGLWRRLPLELSIEAGMAAAAIAIYWQTPQSRARRVAMAAYVVAIGALTIVGQATATEVPPRNALIGSWIVMPLALAAVAAWIDRVTPKRAA